RRVVIWLPQHDQRYVLGEHLNHLLAVVLVLFWIEFKPSGGGDLLDVGVLPTGEVPALVTGKIQSEIVVRRRQPGSGTIGEEAHLLLRLQRVELGVRLFLISTSIPILPSASFNKAASGSAV